MYMSKYPPLCLACMNHADELYRIVRGLSNMGVMSDTVREYLYGDEEEGVKASKCSWAMCVRRLISMGGVDEDESQQEGKPHTDAFRYGYMGIAASEYETPMHEPCPPQYALRMRQSYKWYQLLDDLVNGGYSREAGDPSTVLDDESRREWETDDEPQEWWGSFQQAYSLIESIDDAASDYHKARPGFF